jgi:endonuclease G
VYDPTANKAWAHWIENSDTAKAGKPIGYQELAKRTGINFLPNVK